MNIGVQLNDSTVYKFKGRAFTVNYRKAPQYPWPCALQDVLAACAQILNINNSPR